MKGLFTAIERAVIEKSEKICREALKSAAYELQQDIKNNICYRIVDDYYDEYTPKKYKRRMYSLYGAWEMSASIAGDRLHFRPRLNSDKLPQHYSGSQYHKADGEGGSENPNNKWVSFKNRSDDEDNGLPSNEWIMDNFFHGIHPGYYLDRKLGVVVNNSVQFPGVVPKMGKYVSAYRKSGNMIDILAKYLKQACHTYG